jgi:hypothetical protein
MISEGDWLNLGLTEVALLTTMLPGLVVIGMAFRLKPKKAKFAQKPSNAVLIFSSSDSVSKSAIDRQSSFSSIVVVPDEIHHVSSHDAMQVLGHQNDYEEAVEMEQSSTVLPNMNGVINHDGCDVCDEILIGENHTTEYANEGESENEHVCVHEAVAEEAVLPVNGEVQLPMPDVQLQQPAADEEGSSPGMILISIDMLSGNTLCEHRIRDSDSYTIWDLKSFVGYKVRLDPLMIVLLHQQSETPLDNRVIVARLPSASQTRQLSLTAVLSKTKAYVRDELILQSDCVPDDASWPSLDYQSFSGNCCHTQFLDEESDDLSIKIRSS